MTFPITEKERKAEERHFKRVEKMIERKDRKALEREMRAFIRDEKRDFKKFNKASKDDWL